MYDETEYPALKDKMKRLLHLYNECFGFDEMVSCFTKVILLEGILKLDSKNENFYQDQKEFSEEFLEEFYNLTKEENCYNRLCQDLQAQDNFGTRYIILEDEMVLKLYCEIVGVNLELFRVQKEIRGVQGKKEESFKFEKFAYFPKKKNSKNFLTLTLFQDGVHPAEENFRPFYIVYTQELAKKLENIT